MKAWLSSITGKTKVKLAALGFLLFSIPGYVVDVPPEYQDKIIRELQEICPLGWRPLVGHSLHLFAYGCVAYGLIHASHTGPDSHPKNDPDDKA